MAMVLRSQEAAAASRFSSMTSSDPCFSYDVFLSFRGEDTRRNFSDHLYTALKQVGIRTFRDDDEMDRGKLLAPELKKAICQSAISIIVFSENYASSKWCLDEVLTIMEERERLFSKHEVIPVFYDVEPSGIRNQTGRFAEAFGRYNDLIEAETDHQKKKEWVEKVKAWRVSLIKAANLTGMVLANGCTRFGFSRFLQHWGRICRGRFSRKVKPLSKLWRLDQRLAVGATSSGSEIQSGERTGE